MTIEGDGLGDGGQVLAWETN